MGKRRVKTSVIQYDPENGVIDAAYYYTLEHLPPQWPFALEWRVHNLDQPLRPVHVACGL